MVIISNNNEILSGTECPVIDNSFFFFFFQATSTAFCSFTLPVRDDYHFRIMLVNKMERLRRMNSTVFNKDLNLSSHKNDNCCCY